MTRRISNAISAALCGLAILTLAGCASVKSTAQYYIPYSTKVYPAKDPKAEIPIIGKAPKDSYIAIGRLAFETDQDWGFLRKSMEYNARMNGADAVLIKNVSTRSQKQYNYIPPQTDWVPYQNYYRQGDQVYSNTNWVPFFRPGYVQQWIEQITAIDAEMIVHKN